VTLGLSVRARLLLATVGVASLALAIGVVAFNVFLGQRLSASATNTAKAQAEAELSSLRIENGKVISREGPDEGAILTLTWVFRGTSALEAPRSTPELDRAARQLAGAPEGRHDLGEHARLYVIPVTQAGARYGTVVAAVPLGAYSETARAAFVGSIVLAAVLLATMTVLTWWMLGRALHPVQRMTESAAQWSRHDLDQRFGLGEPRDEFTRLAATLDDLLERIAESLRHEQRLTAELSHELRTPLARVQGETELLLRRPRSETEQRAALAEIARSVDEMATTIDTLLAAARHEAGLTRTTSDLRDTLTAAAATITSPRLAVRVHLPERPVYIAAEPDLLARMVQPVAENARRYGKSSVDIELTRDSAFARVHIRDDGPGIAMGEEDSVFEPGWRGSAATDSNGAGLGLALARRIARSTGGDISADPTSSGGDFLIRLPVHQ